MAEIRTLLFTPRPKGEEALLPYLVRLTEANAYPDPMAMLSPAGVKAGQFQTGTVPVAIVAGLLGCHVETVEHLDHIRGPDALRSKTRWLAGHDFPSSQVRLASAHLCPECLEEDGYVHVFWSLRHAVACPRHGSFPIEGCGSCGRELRWRRPALLECECGARITRGSRPKKVSEPVLTALMLVQEKLLERSSGLPELAAAGYPLEDLIPIRPAGLLVLADRLAKLPHVVQGSGRQSQEVRGLDALHRILEDWPAGFHRFLARAIQPKSFQGYFPLGKWKGSLHARLFRGPEPDRFPFLEAEFMRFGLEVSDWGRPVVSSTSGASRSLQDIAATAGVKPEVARRLIETGHIDAVRSRRAGFYRCDLQTVARRRPRLGVWYTPAQAADVLKLPEGVVAGWAKSQCTYALGGAFHERDLYRLHQTLSRLVLSLKEVSESQGITLGRVLAAPKYSIDQKVAVLDGLMTSSISALGRCGAVPRAIVLLEEEVEALVRSRPQPIRPPDPREVGVQDAAEILGVDSGTIFGLLDEDHLAKRAHRPPVQGGCRVDGVSVLAFAEQWVAASLVSGRTGRRLGWVHKSSRQRVLRVRKRSSNQTRIFIARSSLNGESLPSRYVDGLRRLRDQVHSFNVDVNRE